MDSKQSKKIKTRSKGGQRTFRGPDLLQIAMPLGGIGAGCICLNGYGGLQDFSIRHAPATSADPDRHVPQDAGFALLHLPGSAQTRLVEGPFPPEKIYNLGLKSQGYNGGGYEGLPRFRDCAFKGEYPFGTVSLSDPDLPLEVTITGFNPFIPLDDVNSGIPCAILEYTLHNPSAEEQAYQFSYHLTHLAQKDIQSSPRSAAISGLGVSFWNEETPFSATYGSAALGVLAGDPLIKARWFRGGWFDAISALWREVSTAQFQANDELPAGAGSGRNGGSILLQGNLAAGESITYPVVITWHFPNIGGRSVGLIPAASLTAVGEQPGEDPRWRPFYAGQWKDALEVLHYVRQNYASLRQRTQAFHDALFATTLPAEVLDAVSANLGILKSPTVLRHEDGLVWAWEGCFCDQGCCAGSCTHVWNYAQAMPHLYPALERTLRQHELEDSMDERGHINFRAAPPGLPAAHDFHAAADGQLGGIIKVYREWLVSGDRVWLERMYPLAKRSLDFCIENWDPRRRGLVEEPHHNTYDIEFWGPDGLCCSFYLGALEAMAALAQAAGHPEDAEAYAELARKGAQAIEGLFNGEYYEQKILTSGLREQSFALLLARPEAELSDEERLLKAEGPKYQVGSGCLSDGVFGAWLARLAGLEGVQERAHIRSHLAAVFRHNFKPSLWEHANVQRPGYALGDEPGLLLCTWPRGGKPTLPFVYSDEVWTGIEYQVASHLVAEGLVDEGLGIVRSVRRRYDGHTRNPWNEYECGNYYARAMASYALLIAFSGFQYDAPGRALKLAPQLETQAFTCFFSTASGWGTFTLRRNRLEIDLCEGELAINKLHLTRLGKTQVLHPGLVCRAGKLTTIPLKG